MSTTTHTPTTKREVLIARDAFDAGATELYCQDEIEGGTRTYLALERVRQMAAKTYRLPKVTRPRAVEDSDGDKWRWTPENGLEWAIGDEWKTAKAEYITEDCRAVVADLLTNPTEEVEDTE